MMGIAQTIAAGISNVLASIQSVLDALASGVAVSGSVEVANFPSSQTVAVASLPAQLLTTATGQATASGDTTIVAAPGAGQRLVIADIQIQSESSTAVTVLVKSGSSTVRRRVRLASDGDGLALLLPVGNEIRLSTNESLIFNLSIAATVGWSVRYKTEVA